MRGNIKPLGKGSKPSTGNISDNQIHIILDIPKSTLSDWKNSNSYKAGLYWFLKSMTKQEILDYKEKSKEFSKL
jgi:hypothetical protein